MSKSINNSDTLKRRRTMNFKYEYEKYKEKLMMAIAWVMPRWLVYFCAVRLGAHATTGQFGKTVVPEVTFMEVTFMEALERWKK